jgi:hypothetical protein
VVGTTYRKALSSVSGYRNLESVGVDIQKGLPGPATALTFTFLHPDHFSTPGTTPYIQITYLLQLDYFPTSGPLPCIRTTSVHPEKLPTSTLLTPTSGLLPCIQTTSLHAGHFNTSGTTRYIQTTSLHPNHLATSDQFPFNRPASFLARHALKNKTCCLN